MNSSKYDLKIFVDDPSQVALDEYIPVFHRWIQEQRLAELLIDVADYRHVPDGPGVMLIAHDAHYALDTAEGRLGLLYSRRRETHASRSTIGSVTERLCSVLSCALTACQQLEADSALHGRLRFRGNELLLRSNDRLDTPDTAETYEALHQHLAPCLALLYPNQQVEVARLHTRSARPTVAIKAAEAPDVGTLLARLQSAGTTAGTSNARGLACSMH
jgi:hypothetical protein